MKESVWESQKRPVHVIDFRGVRSWSEETRPSDLMNGLYTIFQRILPEKDRKNKSDIKVPVLPLTEEERITRLNTFIFEMDEVFGEDGPLKLDTVNLKDNHWKKSVADMYEWFYFLMDEQVGKHQSEIQQYLAQKTLEISQEKFDKRLERKPPHTAFFEWVTKIGQKGIPSEKPKAVLLHPEGNQIESYNRIWDDIFSSNKNILMKISLGMFTLKLVKPEACESDIIYRVPKICVARERIPLPKHPDHANTSNTKMQNSTILEHISLQGVHIADNTPIYYGEGAATVFDNNLTDIMMNFTRYALMPLYTTGEPQISRMTGYFRPEWINGLFTPNKLEKKTALETQLKSGERIKDLPSYFKMEIAVHSGREIKNNSRKLGQLPGSKVYATCFRCKDTVYLLAAKNMLFADPNEPKISDSDSMQQVVAAVQAAHDICLLTMPTIFEPQSDNTWKVKEG